MPSSSKPFDKAPRKETEVLDDLMVSVARGSNTVQKCLRSKDTVGHAKKSASQKSFHFEGENGSLGKGGPEDSFSLESASAKAMMLDWSISEEMIGKMSMEGNIVPSKCDPKQTHIHDIKVQWRKKQVSRQQQIHQENKVTWWAWLRSISPSIPSPGTQGLSAGEKYTALRKAYAVNNSHSQQATRSRRVARASV